MAILLRNMLFKEALSSGWAGSETVCQVTACQLRTMNGRSFRLFYPGEVKQSGVSRERSMIRFDYA